MSRYTKQAKSSQEHIATWQERGLSIPDVARAERYLAYIGYYRLSAYTIPFQIPHQNNHKFKLNISFDDILQLYIFDRKLRLLIMDAIERIEVSVRAQICNVMSLNNSDPFWYLKQEYFLPSFKHENFLSTLQYQLDEESKRLRKDLETINKRIISEEEKNRLRERVKKENFIRHYIANYTKPELPPSWMMIEMLTFGDLSSLYSAIKHVGTRKQIAKNLGLQAEVLDSWLKTFRHVRNICAHHGRLWNRELGLSLKIPTSESVLWLKEPVKLLIGSVRYEKRIYSVLIAIQTFLYRINPKSSWAKRLKELLEQNNVSKVYMGIPEEWYKDPFWKNSLK
jgi:abortive infection bacteriophage resistance protein